MYHFAVSLSVWDPSRGAPVPLTLRVPPALCYRVGGALPREAWTAAALERAASFLGLMPRRVEAGEDLVVGGPRPASGAWLEVGPQTGDSGDPAALDMLRLTIHPRRPLAATRESLAAAAAERARLLTAVESLRGAPGGASPRAVSGYLQRFREALRRDLDLPEALACVRDALRPGALSPASRAAVLAEAFPVLGFPYNKP